MFLSSHKRLISQLNGSNSMPSGSEDDRLKVKASKATEVTLNVVAHVCCRQTGFGPE